MIDGLKDEQRNAIIEVLSANENVERVVLFGSRATETYSATSDIDITLFGDGLTHIDQTRLAGAVDELPYPHKVDLLIYRSIRNDKLRGEIDKRGVEWFNRWKSGGQWQQVALGDVLTLQRGFDLSRNKRQDGPYPVIASTGPVGSHQEFKVEGPGVVIGRSGSIGGGQYIKTDFWPLNTTLWVKDFKGNDRKFCYYLLRSLDLASFNAGSGVPTLNRNHIHPMPVHIPPLSEQRRIAHILGTLDDTIELNRRTNETLEEMARAIFKDWFVDFGPVRAKMEGRDAYLPEEIWRLFPDRLVESELGEVPEGWGVGEVADLCTSVTSGGTPARKELGYWEGGTIPWYKTGELQDAMIIDSEEHITPFGLENSSAKMWPIGTVLFALYASPTVGRLGVLANPGTANQATAGLIPAPRIGTSFLKHTLIEAREPLQNIAVGAAQQNINQRILKEHKIVIPRVDVVAMFNLKAASIHQGQLSNAKDSQSLGLQRDALLPSLIAGRWVVSTSERRN